MNVNCPHCDQVVVHSHQLAGRQCVCPGCNSTFEMPGVVEPSPRVQPARSRRWPWTDTVGTGLSLGVTAIVLLVLVVGIYVGTGTRPEPRANGVAGEDVGPAKEMAAARKTDRPVTTGSAPTPPPSKKAVESAGGQASPKPAARVSRPTYEMRERKMRNQALILSVRTKQFDRAEEIARELVDKNKHHYMVIVFFYASDRLPCLPYFFDENGEEWKNRAVMRYEWTGAQGLVKRFDLRLPPPRKERDDTLADYRVLFKIRAPPEVTMPDGRVFGAVLVPSLSPATPSKDREDIARRICRQERMNDISLYSTEEAYKADYSTSYRESHPDAMNTGFLGSIRDGKFDDYDKLRPPAGRVWHHKDGSVIATGDFHSQRGRYVVIELEDGTTKAVRYDWLSAADRQYVDVQ